MAQGLDFLERTDGGEEADTLPGLRRKVQVLQVSRPAHHPPTTATQRTIRGAVAEVVCGATCLPACLSAGGEPEPDARAGAVRAHAQGPGGHHQGSAR